MHPGMNSMRILHLAAMADLKVMVLYLEVSWNRGTPKSSSLKGFSIVN